MRGAQSLVSESACLSPYWNLPHVVALYPTYRGTEIGGLFATSGLSGTSSSFQLLGDILAKQATERRAGGNEILQACSTRDAVSTHHVVH